jgi:Protein kinase domain/WD domain, G-beta repeat
VGLVGRLTEDFAVPGGLAPGVRVAGYRVEEPLGAGGMSAVYRARDERLGRLVALKVLAPALAADGEFRQRFTAESRAAAAVDHPNIIPVYEAGQADGALFIAMRLVAGGDLRRVLADEGPLAPGRAAWFLSPVASALDAAHRAGLVHRDVKPANVLVDKSPDRPEHVYLSDFGISKSTTSAGGLTGTRHYLGTPEFTPPEQLKGPSVDGRADQYALACVAWLLLTGTVPFQRDQGLAVLFAHLHEAPPRLDALRPDLPAAGQVLARALAKDPGERYPSCGEFTDALREALGLPPYRPAGPAAPARRAAAAGLAADGHRGTAAGGALGPTQDIVTPGQRVRPGPDLGSKPARPARRRRYLALTLAGTVLAAATALSLLLATASAPRSRTVPQGGTPTASQAARRTTTEPAATATAGTAKPATAPVPTAGTLAATLHDPASKGVRAMAAGPGGILAAGDANGSTYLWDIATRKVAGYLTDPGSKGVDAVAFGPGGILAAGDANGRANEWDTATGQLTLYLIASTRRGVSCVAFGTLAEFGSDSILAAGDGTGVVSLVDRARLGKSGVTVPGSVIDPASKGVNAVAFGPGSTLAAGDENGTIDLTDTATELPEGSLADPASKGVSSLAAGPGSTLAAGDANGSVYLWDTVTQLLTGSLTDPAGKGVSSVVFGRDGTLAAGDENGRIYLWHIGRSG